MIFLHYRAKYNKPYENESVFIGGLILGCLAAKTYQQTYFMRRKVHEYTVDEYSSFLMKYASFFSTSNQPKTNPWYFSFFICMTKKWFKNDSNIMKSKNEKMLNKN